MFCRTIKGVAARVFPSKDAKTIQTALFPGYWKILSYLTQDEMNVSETNIIVNRSAIIYIESDFLNLLLSAKQLDPLV